MAKKSKVTVNNLGGWHPELEERKKYAIQWPIGSIFANEGRRLYDLIRGLKPELIVEVGGYYGCSSSWMALAVKANKKGKIISIDNNILRGEWSMIPEELKQYIELMTADAFTCEVPENIDIVFEDGMHSPFFTRKIAERFKPSMAFVAHDYKHNSDSGKNVKLDFDWVFGEPDEIFFEKPSDCGLAIKYM